MIKAIREDAVLLEITPKVQIKVERNAVQRIAEKSAPLKEDRNEPDVEDAPEEDSQEEQNESGYSPGKTGGPG